jgi:dihydroxyacid dehydratase/phosphogluconate dehydratase
MQAFTRTHPMTRQKAPDDFRSFGHRSRMNQMGYAADYVGKPLIAIINAWSDLNQCHAPFKHCVEDVKRGTLQAGGFPMELPAVSLSENKVKPTTMLYRNFLAMKAEELIRSRPVDGAVLMGGCDKTTPPACCWARSRDFRPGRPHATRQLARQGAQIGVKRVQILGRAPCRQYIRQGLGRDGSRDHALL